MKITSGLIIAVVIFICALLPILVYGWLKRKGKTGDNILAALICLSGGTFLGVYIMHLGPEAKVKFYFYIIQKDTFIDIVYCFV